MDQQNPTTSTASATPSTSNEPPLLPPPQPQSQPQPPSSAPSPLTTPNPNPSPNPNPNQPSRPSAPMMAPNPSARPHHQAFPRTPWQHPHFSPFSSSASSSPAPSLPASAPAATSAPQPRAAGGMAIGVPATTLPSPSPTTSFPSSFGQQQFGALARGPAGLPEPVSTASSSQARPGMQGMGMIGSLNSSPQIRPGAIATPHHPRPIQSTMRPSPSSSNTQSPASQNFQSHSFVQSLPGGPSTSSPAPPNAAKNMPSPRQPWMTTAPQGRPPLPSPAYRPQMTSPQVPPRSITAQLQQQQQPFSSTPQQQQQPQQQPQHGVSPQPQPTLPSHQPPEHPGQQFPQPKLPQASPQQQQVVRTQASGSQKLASPATVLPNAVQPVVQKKANMDIDESSTRMLSKRTIHELVNQIDPLERLDPEVEDILADIADDFIESITTFGCSLAKHRKSERLEAKDILLHLERTWNITLPGFGGDEIKTYKKPIVNDIHKERLAAIKKSVLVADTVNAKNIAAQAAGSAKSNQTKTPASSMFSPNLKSS